MAANQTGGGSPQQLRTLLCSRDVDLAIKCLRSAVCFSADPVEVVIHEDGSLTAADRDKLASYIPSVRILDRMHLDELMAERLARYPHAFAFRQASVWGLKLLDVVLAEPGLCFYMDSDICFFRPFRGLFVEEATRGRCVFLKDTVWQAYSIRPWHLLDRRGLKVASGINTGLTLFDPAVFDLDFADWFLGQTDWRVIPAWTEPTCWAALALRASGHAVDPKQVINLYPSAQVSERTVGAHFLSSYRTQWLPLLQRSTFQKGNDRPEPIRFECLKPLSGIRLGVNQIKRKFQNTLSWHNLYTRNR